MLTIIKGFFAKVLRRSSDPSRGGVRKDVVRYPIQDQAFLDVFWKMLPYGRGPSVSLVVHNREVLKFDCFGEGKGHYHIHGGAERHLFEEKSVTGQIDYALSELRQNTCRYLQTSAHSRVRNFQLDSKRYNEVLSLLKDKMLEYAVKSDVQWS